MGPKNIAATVLVAAVVVPYIGYLVAGEMPFIQDPRGMATVGLILGTAAALVAGRGTFRADGPHRAALVSGGVALALGILALAVGTSEVLLALFVAAIVITWALGEYAASVAQRVPAGHA
ncbi:hypothetical protein ACI797_05695 [Geodermatophilus sp. SYSU D00691]